MWNFFSRDVTREFPYEIVEKCKNNENLICSLCKAVRKTDKECVSIFAFDKTRGDNIGYELTKNCLKRLKTLRHPSILTYLDTYENDDCLYIITEYVEPLRNFIERLEYDHNESYISFGIMNVVKAVCFLNVDGKLRHNNISAAAVFVTEAGEWKLGELGYVTELSSNYPVKNDKSRNYNPPEIIKSSSPNIQSPCAVDSWGLAIFIWEVFNGQLINVQDLKKINKIPDGIKHVYCELVAANPSKRPTAAAVLQRCTQRGEYFNNVLISTLSFLDEIHLKEREEINLFFKDILPIIDSMPKQMAEYKVLPLIIRAYDFGFEGASILPSFLKIANSVEETHYQKVVVPFLVKLFSANDRATRSILLGQLDRYVNKLTPEIINDTLFPRLINGFTDNNPHIREQTVKSMVELVPKLSKKNIESEVLRHLTRLQSRDEHGQIRTNSTVCMGKIAQNIHPSYRSTVLITAFLRALADPFPPVRNAGVLAFVVCQQFFGLDDIGKKILPALCCLTLDPEISVRDNAFKAIKGFLEKLEKVSKNPQLKEELEKDVLSNKASNSVASWTDWAFTAIASKFSQKSSDSKINQESSSKVEGTLTTDEDRTTKNVNSTMESQNLNLDAEQFHGQIKEEKVLNLMCSDSETVTWTHTLDDESLEDSGWDVDSWLSLSADENDTDNNKVETVTKKNTEIPSTTTKRSRPMKLAERLSQQKFD